MFFKYFHLILPKSQLYSMIFKTTAAKITGANNPIRLLVLSYKV